MKNNEQIGTGQQSLWVSVMILRLTDSGYRFFDAEEKQKPNKDAARPKIYVQEESSGVARDIPASLLVSLALMAGFIIGFMVGR